MNNGNTYKGFFCRDTMNGYGEFTWKNGKRYFGNYLNGLKHGFGLFYWNDPLEIYIGYWKYGNRDGIGFVSNTKGRKWGFWSEGKLEKMFSSKMNAIDYIADNPQLKSYKKFLSCDVDSLIKSYKYNKERR